MRKTYSTILLAIALAGCVPLIQDTSGVQNATPAPFAHPGIYSGFFSHGTLTYTMGADGRGRSCFRNQFGGRMFFGDVTYDGSRLHTEDGTFEVDAVAVDQLRLHTKSATAVLSRAGEAPATCREFFEKHGLTPGSGGR